MSLSMNLSWGDLKLRFFVHLGIWCPMYPVNDNSRKRIKRIKRIPTSQLEPTTTTLTKQHSFYEGILQDSFDFNLSLSQEHFHSYFEEVSRLYNKTRKNN